MIWSRLHLVFRRAGDNMPLRRAAATQSRRWTAAAQSDPELVADILRMGRVLVPMPRDAGEALSLDPAQIAYEAGRRDLALDLLALMFITPRELRAMLDEET